MALIRHIRKSTPDHLGRPHGEVECAYFVFEAAGQRYLQLDSYGSQERAHPGKTSQTFQLDEQGAKELKKLLERTFPSI